MKALTPQILRKTFLLQPRLLDRDHVTRLLQQQTPCGISTSPSSSSASSYSIYSSFHLFLLLPFLLLFLFLTFGVADRQTQGGAEIMSRHDSEHRARVTLANMRACHARSNSVHEYMSHRLQFDRTRQRFYLC